MYKKTSPIMMSLGLKPWGTLGKKHGDTPYHSLYFLPRYMQIPFCRLLTLTPNTL